MQELEKILEEIEEATRQEDAPIYCGDMEVDGYVRKSVVEDIIRKYITGSDTAMMENKTIEVLKNNYPKMCKMVNGRYQGGFDDTECDFGQALTIAISALKEIQQYRKIGTVEEIKSAKKYIDLKKRYGTLTNTIDVCAEYVSIGTVEECRTAMKYWKYLRERRCGLDAVVEKCMQYEQIGTVKECREAVKKRKDIIRKHMPGKDKNVHTNQR